jgi:hypothetical protein
MGTRLPKRKVSVKPDRNGDATDERLHYCERRRWKRGREERGAGGGMKISLRTFARNATTNLKVSGIDYIIGVSTSTILMMAP